MEMAEPMVDVVNLSLWYGESKALNEISMQINMNRVTAIIGPSGCGKSTFIRCINRMNDLIESCSIEGSVFIDGQDIYSDKSDLVGLRRKVGMVFQKPNPFSMSIYDNVVFGPRRAGIRSEEILDTISETSLKQAGLWNEVKDELDKNANDLSGGQQQRLCLARVLAMEPEVILMDEPCSALDPISTAKIEELIGHLKKKFTVIIVTHNMQQAQRVSDYTAFFHLGKLIEYGPQTSLFENPDFELTRNYIQGAFG